MVYYSIEMLVGSELMPRKFNQQIFLIITTIFGAMWMAFLFGSIAATVASMSSKETYYQDQIDNVSDNMKSIELCETRQKQVLEYIDLIHNNPSVNPNDMERFFKLLSSNLSLKTMMVVNRSLVEENPHFKSSRFAV